MRISDDLKIREIDGQKFALTGFSKNTSAATMVTFTESCAWLVEIFRGKDFTVDDAVEAIMGRYEVDEATARRDIEAMVSDMKNLGIIK